jgi:hypothetical protein
LGIQKINTAIKQQPGEGAVFSARNPPHPINLNANGTK